MMLGSKGENMRTSIKSTLPFGSKFPYLALVVSIGISFSSGCVSYTAAHPADMIPRDLPVQPNLGKSACITISGSAEPVSWTPLTNRAFTKEAFAKATDLTLTKTGVFKEIVGCSEEPGFQLRIGVVHIGAEIGPSTLHKTSASVVVQWKLFRADGSEQPLWEDEIVTVASVNPMLDDRRYRRALEKACRENIKKAVVQLSKLARRGTTGQTPPVQKRSP